MNDRLRRVLLTLSGAVAVAAATTLVVVRVGRPLYYSDGERGYLGAAEELRQAPMLMWGRPQAALELPGPVRGRVQVMGDGSFLYGRVRDDNRTELVRYDPARRDGAPEPIATLVSSGHDLAPALAPDGGTLYFASDRGHADGGGFDLWSATVRSGEIFAPHPLGDAINTVADESDPAVDPQTDALVFVRRQDSVDARGRLSLWTAPLDGSAPPQPLWPDAATELACIDRDPAFAPDGQALWFVRQLDFGPPTLMRAWRHAGVFTDPAAVPVTLRDVNLHGPALLDGGRVLQFVTGEGLVYRAAAVAVHPWWQGQAWLERLLLLTLALALLIWILLALGQRWRALDIVTWCLIASVLLHVLILLWLRGVEIVRHYRAPAPRLGEIEVTLVASGSSVASPDDAAPGPDLAQELRFRGHAQALTAPAPTPALDAAPESLPRARPSARDAREPEPATPDLPSPTLAEAVAAAEPMQARAAKDATRPAPSSPVAASQATPSPAARRAAEAEGQAFVVQVPAAAAAAARGGSLPAQAPAGAFVPTSPAADLRPAPSKVADATPAVDPVRGTGTVAADPTEALPAVALAAAAADAGVGASDRRGLAVVDLPAVASPPPLSALTPALVALATAASANSSAPTASAAGSAAAAMPELQDSSAAAAVTTAVTAARAPAAATAPIAEVGRPAAASVSPVPVPEHAAPGSTPVVATMPTPATVLAPGARLSALTTRAPDPLPSARPLSAAPPRLEGAEAVAAAARAMARGTAVRSAQPVALVAPPVALASAPPPELHSGPPAAPTTPATVVAPRALLAQVEAPPIGLAQRGAALSGPRPQLVPEVVLREPGGEAVATATSRSTEQTPREREPTALVAGAAMLGPSGTTPAPIRSPSAATPPAAASVPRSADLLAAASPPLPAAARSAPPVAPRRIEVAEVALRDVQAASSGAGGTTPSSISGRLDAGAPLPPVAGLAIAPLAARRVDPRRARIDVGTADVARGITPPGSLLPLPAAAPARATGRAMIAALPELYRSRFGPEKVQALEAFGGSEETEAAVRHGLAYLASIQRPDGAWGRRRRTHDKYGEVWVGKSALCLLAFLGAGHTQNGSTEHAATVRKGLAWLLAQQDPDTGHFGETSAYSHGITTYALAECYALTKDEGLRRPVERAVAWILANQNRGRDRRNHGGWGYFSPTLRPEDRYARASVSAWMIMALESAQMSGVEVPPSALRSAEAFLWFMFDSDGGYFLYNREPDRLRSEWRTLPGSTPASVFCLLLLGNDRSDERLAAAEAWILERAPTAYRRYSLDDFVLRARGNVYFWYYGSLACFLAGGDVWATWNAALKRVLLEGQSQDGSFAPIDEYADYAGDDDRDRAFTTAMCVLSLEVYYRYFTPLLLKPKAK